MAIADAAAPVLTQSAARAPLGVITFDSPIASATDVIATYQTINKTVDIQGLDLGFDYIFSPLWSMAATYSWVSDVIFEDVRDAQGNALALNAPDHKASLTARWRDEVRGLSVETRGRYANTFPVNSGVYASNRTFPAPAVLNPNVPDGTYTNAATGTCSEATPASCVYTYPAVPVNMFLDLGFSWRLPIRGSQQIMWSHQRNEHARQQARDVRRRSGDRPHDHDAPAVLVLASSHRPSAISHRPLMAGGGCLQMLLHPLLDSARRPIVGHRGNAAHAPENTLESFRQALAAGAECLELDVRLSADGVAVVIHDPTLDRTTSGSGAVAELSARPHS